MSPPRQRFIPELLVIHAEELEFLWGRRRRAITSSSLTVRDLGDLNERIESHLRGLVVTPEALPELIGPRLSADDRDAVFAGAYPLIQTARPALLEPVIRAFSDASGEQLAGLRDALSMAITASAQAALRRWFEQADAVHAVAAAAALASHGMLEPTAPRLVQLLVDGDPEVAPIAWKILARVDEPGGAVSRPFADAIRGKDLGVRNAALGAAIWRGEPWASELVERLAASGDETGLNWLAALGGKNAVAILLADQGTDAVAQLHRAGRMGHPALVEQVLEAMHAADPLVAAAAGDAFVRITGQEIERRRTSVPVAADADDFQHEFAGDVWLPDPRSALRVWERDGAHWRSGQRWCRGFEISTRLSDAARQDIDLEALGDFAARAALGGKPAFSLPLNI